MDAAGGGGGAQPDGDGAGAAVEVARGVARGAPAEDRVGLGPLQPLMDDPTVEEVWVNEPGRVFVARSGRSELTTVVLDGADVADLVERMLSWSGRRLDRSSPFVDAALPDGSRLHVVIPDVTARHWAVNIRKFVAPVTHLEDLVPLGALSRPVAALLEACVAAGLNILVSGATQSGKTTFLNALANAIPARERLVTCEEVFELQPLIPDVVAMQTRQPSLEGTGEIRLRRLVKEALRMRPTRLIVGEVRQDECLDLLIALNSGIPGLCTVHANSARDAVVKMCTLPLLAGDNVTSAFVVPTVATCVDLVVHLTGAASGRRRLAEVVALPGRVEGGVAVVEEVLAARGNDWEWLGGFPPHRDRFDEHGLDLTSLLAAVGPAAPR